VIFSALPSEIALQAEAELRRQGFFVFSNASAFRYEEDVPVIIPEINACHAALLQKQLDRYGGFVLPTSNCSTSGLAMVLKALEELSVRRVFVNTMQSVSGAGRRGVAAIEIGGNLIPYIPREEEKIVRETSKILATLRNGALTEGGPLVEAVCCRVNTCFGHLETLFVELEKPVKNGDAAKLLSTFLGSAEVAKLPSAPASPIVVLGEADRPQPLLDSWHSGGMAVVVGHIRSSGRNLSLVLLVNNLLRGAAGNCVLNAELLLKQGLTGPWREE
jgi:aspartate-semialdehyde dehydrogenase